MELKIVYFTCILAIIGATQANEFHCETTKHSGDYTDPLCYVDTCTKSIHAQIVEELTAAFNYLLMATHFDQETVNRPGLAKFLYEAGSEERQHAIMMIDYLTMRGIKIDRTKFENGKEGKVFHAENPLDYRKALETSLNMEILVTKLIYKIVENCATDFHGADVFTDPILAEQHEGIRKLQGYLKTYDDMMAGKDLHESELALAEYMFDMKLMA